MIRQLVIDTIKDNIIGSTFALFHSPVLSVRIRDTILKGSFGSRCVDERIKRDSDVYKRQVDMSFFLFRLAKVYA